MSRSKRSKATADNTSQNEMKLNTEFSEKSADSSSSYGESSFELKSTQVKTLGRQSRARISKQQLKRLRNREAARKSRNMKKDLLNRLADENNILKEQNAKLKLEIQSLKKNNDCPECPNQMPLQALENPFEGIPVAQTIVSEHFQSKENRSKTEDDMRYERIVAESEDLQGWQKFFLAIIFAVLIFWINKGEAPNSDSRFGFFSFSFNSHETNETLFLNKVF